MSLRTKILAAVVGLNLLVLLLGISILVFVLPPTPGVPPKLLALVAGVSASPGVGGREVRVRALRQLRDEPGVRSVVWLEEAEDGDHSKRWLGLGEEDPAPSAAG